MAKMQTALERLEHSLSGLQVLTASGQRRRHGADRAAADRASMTRRVGAVDIGTNSTRLLVADVSESGGIAEVERLLEITRLGDRVDADRRLSDEAIARVDAVLERYAARDGGSSRPSPCSRSRRAPYATPETAAEFLADVGARHGFATRLLTGDGGGGDDLPRRLLAPGRWPTAR